MTDCVTNLPVVEGFIQVGWAHISESGNVTSYALIKSAYCNVPLYIKDK